ncbi:uncharacterized protein A1O9_03238 [Exophiala aquamarina CBS 119918]|uniref:Mitochondrial import inner membrane translocase subunit TIM50 n=1 Tax=Exophiala aquamarina CBS 119918 TaxID=1182545 RepID=A0A072Q195_9EURO|nr:uncharacterized protein A1O9_03238 [Exophiala aquamarina CBS 119918]KEF61670.1 hypothetical protein A1O9_03238 [Exophiala aquamarina CBS 119918]
MSSEARGPGRRNRSQKNAIVPGRPPVQRQRHSGNVPGAMHPSRAEQICQGELYVYHEHEYENRVNTYETVDSWRAYKDDDLNLQSSLTSNPYQPLGSSNGNIPTSAQLGLNARAPAFTPYQPRRLVHNCARYPNYRVDKPYRVSNGVRERQILQQALQEPQSPNYRYPLHSRQGGQSTPRQLSANTPISSIESGFVPLRTSTNLIPSSLPPRFADRRSYSRTPPNVKPPTRPLATAKYLKDAGRLPEAISSPKNLLVILDLNGTLLVRPKNGKNPMSFKLRPGVTSLLEYLFANHVVMVYSSARPANVQGIVKKLFHPRQQTQLAGIWARDKLELDEDQYNAKVQVYKKLDKIWNDPIIRASAGPGQRWDQTNTVLVDDSRLKAAAQPHNLVQVPEFENNAPKEGGAALRSWQLQEIAILKSLEQRLEELKWQVDVSRLIREWQTGKRSAPGVVDETIDQKTQRNVQEQLPGESSCTASLQSVDHMATELAQNISYSPQIPLISTPTDHGSDVTKESSLLDVLEEEMNRTMKNTHLKENNSQRSESPINESVFAELFSRAGNKSPK